MEQQELVIKMLAGLTIILAMFSIGFLNDASTKRENNAPYDLSLFSAYTTMIVVGITSITILLIW